jgi:hypothetical protein
MHWFNFRKKSYLRFIDHNSKKFNQVTDKLTAQVHQCFLLTGYFEFGLFPRRVALC